MNVTNTTGDVVRTPTIQPEEWQPGETRDLPEAEARALATSSAFTLTATEPAQTAAQPTPVEAQPAPVEPAPLGQPQPEPTPAPADPSPFASAEAPGQPAL